MTPGRIKRCLRALSLSITFAAASISHAATGDVPVTRVPVDDAPVSVRSWLVAGMFPSPFLSNPPPDGPARRGFDTDYLVSLGGEAAARPRAGTRVPLPGGGAAEFTPRAWRGDYTDLTDVFGGQSAVLAYLFAELESPVAQTVYVHFGVNDAGKVWIDGNLVLTHVADGAAIRSQDAVRVDLPAGRTPVLVKVDQAGANWGVFLDIYGKSAHEAVLAASDADAVRQYTEKFDRLRAAVGRSRRRSPAWSATRTHWALYCAERL